jgi:hypothetical protein
MWIPLRHLDRSKASGFILRPSSHGLWPNLIHPPRARTPGPAITTVKQKEFTYHFSRRSSQSEITITGESIMKRMSNLIAYLDARETSSLVRDCSDQDFLSLQLCLREISPAFWFSVSYSVTNAIIWFTILYIVYVNILYTSNLKSSALALGCEREQDYFKIRHVRRRRRSGKKVVS